MTKTVDFFYDFASPYSYLAATQIDAVCERQGAVARWRPFLLGAVFKETDNHSPVTIPAKAKYLPLDLEDWAKHYGIEMTMPAEFPINSVRANRAALVAEQHGLVKEFSRALYEAYWVRGRNASDPEVIAESAERVGLEPANVLAGVERPEIKAKLKTNTAEALALGAFGAPTMVYEGRIYWGNDRLQILEDALKG